MSGKNWREEVRAFYRRIGCRKRIDFLETCAECLEDVFKVSEFLISGSKVKIDIWIYTEGGRGFEVVLLYLNRTWTLYELLTKNRVETKISGVLGNYDVLRILHEIQD